MKTRRFASISMQGGPGSRWALLHHTQGRKWTDWARNGAETRPNVSRSMPECFRGVNEVIHDDSQGGKPRDAIFGYGFSILHNFASKSMQNAVGGQSETVGHQVGDI